nr:unnamed protein product [Spirometra erinaceieuropaei]
MANGYPRNFIERNGQPGPSRSSVTERPKIWRALPYIDGVSEAVSRLLRPLRIGIAHRPESTIRNLVMRPKTPLPRGETTNVMYRIQCSSCDMNYIGETGKRLHTRVAEHMRAVRWMDPLSLVAEHCANSGHTFAFQNGEILGRGNDGITRETIEAWYTGANSINRSVALPAAYQALRTQLSEQKSRVRLRQDRNPSRCLGTRINEHKLAIRRRDPLSLVFAHALEYDHRFNWDGTEVVAMANTKRAREFLEAWYSDAGSINRHVDLDAHYEGLRSRMTAPYPNHASTTANTAARIPTDSPPALPLQHGVPSSPLSQMSQQGRVEQRGSNQGTCIHQPTWFSSATASREDRTESAHESARVRVPPRPLPLMEPADWFKIAELQNPPSQDRYLKVPSGTAP